ncbi:MAG: CBS and ACT domain-containing protein, partial [Candidatus Saccharibacteria bacterium]
VDLETTVSEAFQIMRDNNIRRVPVMDQEKLVSIVTLRDLAEVSPSSATSLSIFEINYILAKTTIGSIIDSQRKLFTIKADENLERAALVMRENKIGAVPVLEGDKLVGIITETDIFDAFIDILGVNRPGTRIDMEVGDRVGLVAQITGIIARLGISIENIVLLQKQDSTKYELILRVDTLEPDSIVKELEHEGFKVTAKLRRQGL